MKKGEEGIMWLSNEQELRDRRMKKNEEEEGLRRRRKKKM